ncbi:Heat shock protein GrpE [plant metagenome]|uniref:Protein GrpE n=2 Tax=root TaxID=1 RepID=A0A1C3JYX6_9BURK|nr:nucleotide exchange factor GrpE [Orrella dioscoreae]SBT24384.1 Heat shock protein GrpE [Orrella dioscoreae]SOE47927.1 Heat shock protein GrpE [Orrella dioscoreae]
MTATHESAAPGPDQEDQAAAPAQPQTVGSPDAQAQSQAEAASVTQEALDAAQAQVAALQDQLLRAQAEMENVRRRAQEEVSKARKFGIESFAESLVPVRDSLEAALAQGEQTAEALLGGVDATLKQLTSAFERNHLKAIAPEPGEKFDPHQHQAISSVPSEHPANTVVNCLQKGYLIADRVLRPALVMVSAGPAA